jgi:CDP-diacylglycerol---glycerol-3-phosphate 3-phosphatidyltransferase
VDSDLSLANRITLIRILLIPFFLALTVPNSVWTRVLAAIIFIVACATDPLDGYFARKRGEITDFGTIMDPLADKLLVMTAFVVLVKYQTVAAWMTVIILAREFLITALRTFMSQQMDTMLAASRSGKIKTLTQMIGGSILLLISPFGNYGVEISLHTSRLSNVIMSIIIVTTLWSGYGYFKIFLQQFREQ